VKTTFIFGSFQMVLVCVGSR